MRISSKSPTVIDHVALPAPPARPAPLDALEHPASRGHPLEKRASGRERPGSAQLDARLDAPASKLLALRPRFDTPRREVIGAIALAPIAGVAVEAKALRFADLATTLDASAIQTVEARFGKLSEAQHRALSEAFGGRSEIGFDPRRDYEVRDFLPPLLQALVDRDLDLPAPKTLRGSAGFDEHHPDRELEIGLTMNCHATAYAAARSYQTESSAAPIFFGDAVRMDDLSRQGGRFELVADPPAARLSEVEELGLRPGDLVQFYEVSDFARMTMLLHSAVYVGGGLYFDKPDTEGDEHSDPDRYIQQNETPFRLGTLAMIAGPSAAAVDGQYRVEVRRPAVSLEPASEAFRSSFQDMAEALAEKRGRALGNPLVTVLELSSGGGILAEHAAALAEVPLTRRSDGGATLAAQGRR